MSDIIIQNSFLEVHICLSLHYQIVLSVALAATVPWLELVVALLGAVS